MRAAAATALGAAGSCAVFMTGCGQQSTLATRSPQTHQISLLWWWMFAVATIVFLGAVALLGLAWLRRRVPGLPLVGEREGVARGLVLLFGIAIPIVILLTLFGVANVYVIRSSAAPAPSSTKLTIDVIGHQWWWEVRYPGTQAVTANEIHIPVGTRVNIVASSADVIHSFWVPQLARKIDMIPGRENRVLMYASRPGQYRGQCAEFCGFQHAHMSLFVVAEPAASYQRWLANMAAPAARPVGGAALRGRLSFTADQCASCHQIRGVVSGVSVGPDLTHMATRATLAAAEIPNDRQHLAAWIRNPQKIKPGDRMPDLGIPPDDVAALVAYLDTLR